MAKLESQVRLLDEELEKTDIRAPIDGIVATPFIERKLNQRLEAGDEFCRIVDTRQVTVEMQVPEKELAEVKPGKPGFDEDPKLSRPKNSKAAWISSRRWRRPCRISHSRACRQPLQLRFFQRW